MGELISTTAPFSATDTEAMLVSCKSATDATDAMHLEDKDTSLSSVFLSFEFEFAGNESPVLFFISETLATLTTYFGDGGASFSLNSGLDIYYYLYN